MQRVLIVDDSKTAQIRLKKMLARYELIVDIAFSAEEALGYLTYRTPAVIFMDHHMEGMDGFEALKIIKANANTAMIPVIMYTAQKGDVYVGQARALGALDILSKEVIKPSSLERVLSSLKILPQEQASTDAAETSVEEAAPAQAKPSRNNVSPIKEPPQTPQHPVSDDNTILVQVRSQIARLFEMHIADVRQQIADNSRFVVRRLSAEIEKNSTKEATVDDVPLSVVNAEISAEQRRSAFVSSSLLLLIFLGLGLLAYEMFQTKGEVQQINQDYQNLLDLNAKNQDLIGELTTNLGRQVNANVEPQRNSGLMEALSWALDVDMHFSYDQQPLDEEQMLKVSNLVYRLASAGFIGIVELEINFGNYCLETDTAGNMQLADPSTLAENCTLRSELGQEFASTDYLSIPYLNFEENAVPIREGLVQMNVITAGLDNPRYEYPAMTAGLTAGEWNAAAERNNRVSINFGYL